MSFLSSYDLWEESTLATRKKTVQDCVRFYEDKAFTYILSNLTPDRKVGLKREPLKIEFVIDRVGETDVCFGDNVIYIVSRLLEGSKKPLFFDVAQNTICAVFAHLFSDTASNPDKHTKFGKIAGGFLASITSEFAKGESFEQDMIESFCETLTNEMSIDFEQ